MHKSIHIFLALSLILNSTARADDQLSLKDLGFANPTASVTPATNTALQDEMRERRYHLEQHQLWGLVALAGMGFTILSAEEGKLAPEHAWVAGLTAGAYGISAYHALSAPELKHEKAHGPTLWHRRLAWIHGIGMILTPIAGYMAAKSFDKGERLTGLAEQHKNIAGVTAGALAISVGLVSFEF